MYTFERRCVHRSLHTARSPRNRVFLKIIGKKFERFFFFTISKLLIEPKASECCLKIFNSTATPAAVANGSFFLRIRL